MELFELLGTIIIDNTNANKAIDDTVDNAKQSQNKLSSVFGKVGKAVATAFTAKKVIEFGAACVKSAASAETGFAKVNTLLADGTDTNAYFESIKQGSQETGVAVTDFSEAVYGAISASVDQAHAVSFTTQAIKLAKGGFTNAATAVDVLTTAINAYGLKASDATSIADKLITTQNLGKTTVNELAAAMGKVIPTAKSFNVNLDTLCGTYAIMTKNGIATAEATTYVNGMLNELGKTGTTAANVLKNKTGKSFSQLMASGYSLGDVLEILQEEATKAGMSIGDMFGSQEAAKAANTLIDNVDDLAASTAAMADSAGATEKAYAIMSDTIEEKTQRVKNSFDLIMVSLGEDLTPGIKELLDAAETLMPFLDALAGVVGVTVGSAFTVVGSAAKGLASGINSIANPSKAAAEELGITSETVADAQANVVSLESSLAELKAQQQNNRTTYAETAGAVTSFGSAYAAAQSNISASTDDLTVQIQRQELALQAARDRLSELQAQEQAAAEAAADPVNIFKTATEEYTAKATELVSTFQETYSNIYQAVSGWFAPFQAASTSVKTSVDEIIANMQSQVDFNNTYTQNLAYLKEAGLGSLSEALQSYGAEGAAYAEAICSSLEAVGGASTAEGQKIVNSLQEGYANVKSSQQDLSSEMTLLNGQIEAALGDMTQTYAQQIADLDKSDEALKSATNTMNGLISGIKTGSAGVDTAMSNLGKRMTAALQAALGPVTIQVNASGVSGTNGKAQVAFDGSHASGLDYVPFDGYIAQLHRGEMVVPKKEADVIRNGSADNGNAQIISLLSQILDSMGVDLKKQVSNSNIQIDGRTFGRVVRGYA